MPAGRPGNAQKYLSEQKRKQKEQHLIKSIKAVNSKRYPFGGAAGLYVQLNSHTNRPVGLVGRDVVVFVGNTDIVGGCWR
jgi:hypothetical protein